MAINRDKVYDGAMKLLAAGKFDKGIEELRKLVVDDPKDVRTLLKIAETLHVKMGKRKEALESYDKAATLYTDQGFFLKAVAVFKQMLSVDATNPDMHLRLAELYQQMGYGSQCLLHYQQVVVLYEQQGRSKDTLGILKRMVDLDPENLQSRIKVAELFHQQGMVAEALTEMRQAFELLRSQQRFDDAVRVGEKVCAWDPNAVDVAKELGSIYMQRGDAKSALAKLQVCFRLTPRDLEVLSLIAGAFLALDQTAKSVSVYKEMARIYEGTSDVVKARSYWERVLEFSPRDDDAELALGRRQATVMAGAPATSQTSAPVANAGPRLSAEDDQLQRLMTETDVYVKYGLRDKAIEHLDKIFSLRAQYLPALEKLRQLQNQTNQKAAAVETLRLMIKKGDDAGHPKLAEWKAELARVAAPAAKPSPAPAPDRPASPMSIEGDIILVDDEPIARTSLRVPPKHEDLATVTKDRSAPANMLTSLPSVAANAPIRGRASLDDDLDEPLDSLLARAPARLQPLPHAVDSGNAMQTRAVVGLRPAPAALPPDEYLDDDDEFDAPTVITTALIGASILRMPSFGGSVPSLSLPQLKSIPAVPPEVILDEPVDFNDADALVREALGMAPSPSGMSHLAPPLGTEEGLPADELVLDQEDEPSSPSRATFAALAAFDTQRVATAAPFANHSDSDMLDALAAQAVQDAAIDRSALAAPVAAPAPLDEDFGDLNVNANHTVAYPGPSKVARIGRTADDSLIETGERPAAIAPAAIAVARDDFQDFNLPDDVKNALSAESALPSFGIPEPDGFDALDPLATGTFERGNDEARSFGDVPSLESMDAEAVVEVQPWESTSGSVPDEVADNEADQMSAVRELFVPERGFEDDPANTFFPDELAEAEFFIQQDLLDEAREILEPILEEIEDSERVKHMLARVTAKEAGEPEPPAPWEQRLMDEVAAEIDYLAVEPARELSEPGQISVNEVLAQFKRGIAETVPEDDAATHYDLGIAYREMGLFEDAAGEFQVAARAASRAPDALFLIGLVRLDQSRTEDALRAFDNAIEAPAATKAQRAAAEYQRGVVFADVVGDALNGLIAFKCSKNLGGSSPDLDRRIQMLIKSHGDVDVPASGARPTADGRQKKIGYV